MTTEQIIRNISAIFKIEGMIVTEEEEENLRRVANGDITYEELEIRYINEVLIK